MWAGRFEFFAVAISNIVILKGVSEPAFASAGE
jgi:hypothetical protein